MTGRLVHTFTGGGRTAGAMPPGGTFMGREPGADPSGITLADGTHFALDQQPPIAASHGWGDLVWLIWRRRQAGVRQVGSAF